MMLADAVAAYVQNLTERELDAPLLALLHRLGFDHVHLVHGSYEFGKDLIARRSENGTEYQYCIQSKAGDIGVAAWRDVVPQVDAMRTGTVVHPGFDASLPRKLVLVTNGRLKGAAAVSAQDYNTYHVARGEIHVDVWDIDHLVPRFESVLVEGVAATDRARTLEMLGRLGQGRGTVSELRNYSRPWFVDGLGPSERWGHVLDGAMLSHAAVGAGREDLAVTIAFLLLRAAWESPATRTGAAERDVARCLFRTHATTFWHAVRELDPVDATTRTRSGLDAFTTHPVKVARMCEQLSLLALADYADGDASAAEEIAAHLDGILASTPALAHVVSDAWAFSVLCTAVVLVRSGRGAAAERLLRDTAAWVLDWVEYGSGLAHVDDSASAAVNQLLGPAYEALRPPPVASSYTLTVVLDLAHIFDFQSLYRDLVHDLDALGAMASIVHERAIGDADLIARIHYSADIDPPAGHHAIPTNSSPAGSEGAWFDCLARWATLRDRHVPSILRELLRLDSSG